MADDEDSFFDDDLDASTIDALERQAYTATQQPQQPLRKQAHNASSLTRARSSVLNNNLPWRPPQPFHRLSGQAQVVHAASAPPASAPEPPSSDYGFSDEDVVDLDEPSMVIQPAVSRPYQSRHPHQPRQYGVKPPMDPETEAAYAAADAELGSQTFGRRRDEQQRPSSLRQMQDGNSVDVSALQARIATLEREQTQLKQSEVEARSEVRAKQGEIAIVRSNLERDTKQFEAKIAAMQRLHTEQSAKAKAEIEAQRKEQEKIKTDNRFLEHDLNLESERVKKLNGAKGRPVPSKLRESPRKSRKAPLGDGFDDDEVQVASPSRSKSKDTTPKAGAKRKRHINDSPVAGLSFTQPSQPFRHESSEQMAASFDPLERIVVVQDNKGYKFMQLVLSHSPHEGHERTVEALAKYYFPSNPGKPLSTIFIDDITRAGETELPMKVVQASLKLWFGCLQERVFTAFYLVLDMISFVLRLQPLSFLSQFIDQLVPVCTKTIDQISIPIIRASTNRAFASTLNRQALETQADEVDVERVLGILHHTCRAASLTAEGTDMFWRTIDSHFVLVMLNKAQPITQVIATLHMLAMSARPDSFSVISETPEKQMEQEKQMVDKLTNLLFEIPEMPKDETAYSDDETLELRIEVLNVFKEMCQSNHGTLLLTQHRSAVGRLIRFLDAQVARLYRVRPSLGYRSKTHDLIARSINMTTRLIYHIFRAFDEATMIVQKMHAVHGGYHKFLVSLTRIAFSEQLVFEAGIEDETAEAAHNILDNILGPEDGDAVMKAIETPRGTKGSTTEKLPSDIQSQEGHEDTIMGEPG